MKRIGIIGGGAAGMMAAAILIEQAREAKILGDIHIIIFERNTGLGRKVLISGGGRCNVTTGIIDRKTLATKYTRGYEFYSSTLGKYGPRKIREYFEARGLPLKCEEDNRVFPVSDHGRDVIGFFEGIYDLAGSSLEIHYGGAISSISHIGSEFTVSWAERVFEFDILVLSTGGNAYAHTGSKGDGYTFARALGHSISPLGPSLSSFETQDSWAHELSGISFEQARLVSSSGPVVEGPLLLTHFGITGPSPFTLSSHLAYETISKEQPLSVRLIPISSMTVTDWDSAIEKLARDESIKLVGNLIARFIPRRVIDGLVMGGHLSAKILDQKGATLSRRDRALIAGLLGGGIPLRLIARRAGDEFVTAGGVNTAEISSETLESLIVKDLYFAGEIINIDGVTGGFNLQVAWSTGWRAGQSIIDKLIKSL